MTKEGKYYSEKEKIKFLKVRDVKSPTRAYEFDAGIDFYVPEFNKEFLEDLADKNQGRDLEMRDAEVNPYIAIPAHSRIMIPSGIKCRMDSPGRALIAANKSGVAVKTGLVFGAQVVDYTYKGEIHLSLINTTDREILITPGQKIIQFLEMPVFTSEVEIVEAVSEDMDEITEKFYEGLQDDRGEGGFGSTDKK
jgi:dUTP pyrophosphatase